MKCVFCGGKLESRNVTFIYDYDDDYFLLKMFLLKFACNAAKGLILRK
jgi:hypothetical protein